MTGKGVKVTFSPERAIVTGPLKPITETASILTRSMYNAIASSATTSDGFTTPAARHTAKVKPVAETPAATTANNFAALAGNSSHPADNPEATAAPKTYRIPALVLSWTKSLGVLIKEINDHVEDKSYTLKPAGSNTKLQLRTIGDYRAITNHFTATKVAYHTFAIMKKKTRRFVIRGLPIFADCKEICEDLTNEYKLNVQSVTQLTSRDEWRTRYPLFAVIIEDEAGKPPTNLSVIDKLQQCSISTEAPKTQRGPLQCYRCQRIGHTSGNCHHVTRCVRCGGDHAVTSCPRTREEEPTCSNCKGTHAACYRGCPYLKQAKPTPAPKQSQETEVPYQRSTQRPRLEMPAPADKESWPELRKRLAQKPTTPQAATNTPANEPPARQPEKPAVAVTIAQGPEEATILGANASLIKLITNQILMMINNILPAMISAHFENYVSK